MPIFVSLSLLHILLYQSFLLVYHLFVCLIYTLKIFIERNLIQLPDKKAARSQQLSPSFLQFSTSAHRDRHRFSSSRDQPIVPTLTTIAPSFRQSSSSSVHSMPTRCHGSGSAPSSICPPWPTFLPLISLFGPRLLAPAPHIPTIVSDKLIEPYLEPFSLVQYPHNGVGFAPFGLLPLC